MENSSLISEVAQILHVSCLSDLRYASAKELNRAFRQIAPGRYSLAQWSYALSYISGRYILVEQFDDIALFLKHRA